MLDGEYSENRFKKGGLKSILGMEVQSEGERRRQKETEREVERRRERGRERENHKSWICLRKGKLDRRDDICFGV